MTNLRKRKPWAFSRNAGSRAVRALPDRNRPIPRAARTGKRDVDIVELPGLDHILQPATTGSPAEQGEIATTIDPKALDLVSGWMLRR